MRRIKHFAAALLLVASQASWAGAEEGLAAYNRGDFATALKEFRPLAEQGEAGAQTILGAMYENGKGVPEYYVEAVKWYRLAAEQVRFDEIEVAVALGDLASRAKQPAAACASDRCRRGQG